MTDKYIERKAAGLCVHCGAPKIKGTLCEDCKQRRHDNYEYNKALWAKEGRCPRCGGIKQDDGFKTCPRCRKNARTHWRNTEAKKKGITA